MDSWQRPCGRTRLRSPVSSSGSLTRELPPPSRLKCECSTTTTPCTLVLDCTTADPTAFELSGPAETESPTQTAFSYFSTVTATAAPGFTSASTRPVPSMMVRCSTMTGTV